jgi:hypothetical protein
MSRSVLSKEDLRISVITACFAAITAFIAALVALHFSHAIAVVLAVIGVFATMKGVAHFLAFVAAEK